MIWHECPYMDMINSRSWSNWPSKSSAQHALCTVTSHLWVYTLTVPQKHRDLCFRGKACQYQVLFLGQPVWEDGWFSEESRNRRNKQFRASFCEYRIQPILVCTISTMKFQLIILLPRSSERFKIILFLKDAWEYVGSISSSKLPSHLHDWPMVIIYLIVCL